MDQYAINTIFRVRVIFELMRSGPLNARILSDRVGVTRQAFSKNKGRLASLPFIQEDITRRPATYRVTDDQEARQHIADELSLVCELTRLDGVCFPLLLEVGRMSAAESEAVASALSQVLDKRKA